MSVEERNWTALAQANRDLDARVREREKHAARLEGNLASALQRLTTLEGEMQALKARSLGRGPTAG